jgi:pantoate--beta-alanine ligase
MRQFKKITSLRRFLAAQKRLGKTVSLVPTMGALHAGHKSCIDIARRTGDLQVTSIFVNPTQFGPKEDFGAYPRREARDLRLLAEWGCDVAFLPSADEMYKSRQEVWVEVESLTGVLCGKKRPGHFRGVATVVAKLFNIVAPDIAVPSRFFFPPS